MVPSWRVEVHAWEGGGIWRGSERGRGGRTEREREREEGHTHTHTQRERKRERESQTCAGAPASSERRVVREDEQNQ
jgi:hypothetical protein